MTMMNLKSAVVTNEVTLLASVRGLALEYWGGGWRFLKKITVEKWVKLWSPGGAMWKIIIEPR